MLKWVRDIKSVTDEIEKEQRLVKKREFGVSDVQLELSQIGTDQDLMVDPLQVLEP